MKTVVVNTEKVVSHKGDGMPVIETIEQKISPELTFNKFIKYLSIQNYSKVTVIGVLKNGKKVKEIDKHQAMVDQALRSKEVKDKPIDYKALSEKQADLMANMENRLQALEGTNPTDEELLEQKKKAEECRLKLEIKAEELKIEFSPNIGDENLLKKIQEVEPEFNIN